MLLFISIVLIMIQFLHKTSQLMRRASELSIAVVWRSFLFNSRSICSKLPSLQQLLYGHNYDIIASTETWLKQQYTNGLIDPRRSLPRYSMRQRRKDGRRRLLVDQTPFKHIQSWHVTGVEMICVDVLANSNRYRIIVLYRPSRYSPAYLKYSIKMHPYLDCLMLSVSVWF